MSTAKTIKAKKFFIHYFKNFNFRPTPVSYICE